jgi:hypothetical protein
MEKDILNCACSTETHVPTGLEIPVATAIILLQEHRYV